MIMSELLKLTFDVDGENFTSAGEASVQTKKNLRMLGVHPDVVRRVAIAMYEGGGVATVTVYPEKIEIVLEDKGPGIPDVDLAMKEGFSTAPENIRSLGFGAGMGLPNMKKNTDTMVIDSVFGEGTKITMTVNL